MRVLLVEPDYRRDSIKMMRQNNLMDAKRKDDATLWYPPLGLMKIATYHRKRGDHVEFAIGCDSSKFSEQLALFSPNLLWDRVYITTLFTFDWDNVIRCIKFYGKAVGGSTHKIFVGGIMASLIHNEIFEETGIQPITGVLNSPQSIGLDGSDNIDLLPPDYSILDSRVYAINDTYYAYTTRGCPNRCAWCGVPFIEPSYQDYIDIKPIIRAMREQYGDKARLKLMDNNVLASPHLAQIVDDLLELGYGKNEYTTPCDGKPRKMRVIDFNQGLDANYVTGKNIRLIAKLNIRPMRIAFDRIGYKTRYEKAIRLAHKHGFREFSNYMLYNEKDTPRDLYDRLMMNIGLNREWGNGPDEISDGAIYSYPMRFAPIRDNSSLKQNRRRDYLPPTPTKAYDFLKEAAWVKRFTRNIEIMKGANHGAIPTRPSFATRAIGETYEEFIVNLYMPEELLRNRNKYEKKVYPEEPSRLPGTGDVERFREFVLRLLKNQDEAIVEFHDAVAPCSREAVKKALKTCKNAEVKEWLEWYLVK
jgi:hypothetical protein